MSIGVFWSTYPGRLDFTFLRSGFIDWPDAGDTVALSPVGFTIEVGDGTWGFVTDPADPNSPGTNAQLQSAVLISDSRNYIVELDFSGVSITGDAFVDGFDEAELLSYGITYNGAPLLGMDQASQPGPGIRILGTVGDDTAEGTSGDDTIKGDLGNDSITALEGDDRFWAGAGDTGADTVLGQDGNDTMGGGGGNDSLLGGPGDDLMFGGADTDHLVGDFGDDRAWGGADFDALEGGEGDDILGGGAGGDILVGDENNDTLYGGSGNDTMAGGTGDDVLFGGSENDSLSGGEGSDTLYGGTGDDVFLFDADSGDDSIGGFNRDGDDTLNLSALNLAGMNDLNMQQIGADLWINTGVNTITLYNTLLADVDASDFIF